MRPRGFTYVTFNSQSKRLIQRFRKLPLPNVDDTEYLVAVKYAANAGSKGHEQTGNAEVPGTSIAKRLTQAVTPSVKNARLAIAKIAIKGEIYKLQRANKFGE